MASAYLALHRAAPRWTWRPRTHAMLIAMVNLAFGVALVLNLTTLFSPPRLSIGLSAGPARVAWVLPGSALWQRGVRPGDRVIALDGRVPRQQETGLWSGERVRVQTAVGPVAVDAAMAQHDRSTWPLLLLSPVFLLLGTLVVLRTSRPAVGAATYNLFAATAFTLVLAPSVDHDEVVATVIQLAMIPLLATFFVRFFLTFPTSRGTASLRAALFALPLASLLLSLAALLWPYLFAGAYLVRLAVLLAYLLAGIGLLGYSLATARDRDTRRGLIIISAGTVLGLLPLIVLYAIPSLLHWPVLMAPEHAILALAVLPASFAYAILRHHVLDVPLLQRWLVYGILWGAFLVAGTLVVYARHWLPITTLPEPGQSLVFAALAILLIGVPAGWLHSRLRRSVDRLIFKDSYDYRASLQELSRDLSMVSDFDVLGTSLPGTLCHLMNLDFAAILVRDGDGLSARGVAGAYQPAMLPALAAAAREVADAPRVMSLAYGYLNVLFVPLRTRDERVGYLCLGPKASGEPFRAEDRDLLATLSGHLAAIVHNVSLTDDLHEKIDMLEQQRSMLDTLNVRLQNAHEEERMRLVADIHDEPLQTALHLQRQLANEGERDPRLMQHAALSQVVIDQLRSVCTAMRPSILDDLGLQAALDLLTFELGERAGAPIALNADTADLTLAPAAELVLYRAAQEALNNCLRHAHARTIEVTLERGDDMVELRVTDDGDGFTVPDTLSPLVTEGHLGLAGLQERVQQAGGSLKVSSSIGEGTVVCVCLPLEGMAP